MSSYYVRRRRPRGLIARIWHAWGPLFLMVLAAAAIWALMIFGILAIVDRATGHELAAPPRTPTAMAAYAPDLHARELDRARPSWAHLRRMVAARWDAEHPDARRHRAAHRRTAELVRLVHPYRGALECLARHESHSTWTISTGNGYYGGLQMDRDFARTYGAGLLERKGTPNHWTKLEQMAAAARAINVRGFTPWPNTGRACGLLPSPAEPRSSVTLRIASERLSTARRVGNVQSIADRTSDLLAAILRVPVEHRTVHVTTETPDGVAAPRRWGGWYGGTPDIYLRPWVASDLETRAPFMDAARVLRHELLHKITDLDPTCPRAAREGVPDALAMDTEPQWARLFGFRDYYAGAPGYPGALRTVRRWSVAVTGRPAESVAARQARRSLYPLSCHERARVMGLER